MSTPKRGTAIQILGATAVVGAGLVGLLLWKKRFEQQSPSAPPSTTKQRSLSSAENDVGKPDKTSHVTRKSTTTSSASTFPLISVVFGTNTGTAELFAKTFLSEAHGRGWTGSVDHVRKKMVTTPQQCNDEATAATVVDHHHHAPHQRLIALVDPAQDDLPQKTGMNVNATGASSDESILVPFAKLTEGSILVFIVATYGEGDPTDAFKTTVEALKKAAQDVQTKPLSHLSYAVFGLGDTSYKYFCQTAVDMDNYLSALGATCLYETGYGDARTNLEETYDSWRENIWQVLAHKADVPVAEALNGIPKPELELRYLPTTAEEAELMLQESAALVTEQSSMLIASPMMSGPFSPASLNTSASTTGASNTFLPPPLFDPNTPPFPPPPTAMEASLKNPKQCRVVENRVLTSAAALRPVHHIVIDIKGMKMTYQAGDHCGIFPCNPDAIVEQYLTLLDVKREDWDRGVELLSATRAEARASKKNTLPMRVSLFNAFKWYIDLCGRPKRSALRVLLKYLIPESEEQPTDLKETEKSCRTVLDLLKKHPQRAKDIPPGHFLEVMPRIAPRYFSIASDQLSQPDHIFLTVGIVEDGLASLMLRDMVPTSEGDDKNIPCASQSNSLFIFVRKSTFHLPLLNKKRPLVMIGPGTGVAPLVGFCHRRVGWLKKKMPIGECVLFFGCRKEDDDFLYGEELKAWLPATQGDTQSDVSSTEVTTPLTTLHVAFSRQDPNRKHYVQHDVVAQKEKLYQLIVKDQATLFICGDATHMAKDVEKALIEEVLMKGGGADEGSSMSREAADKYLAQMGKSSRYLKDVWTA